MQIWHLNLLSVLPSKLLLAQHRDCCALRGKCWGRSNKPALRWLWIYPITALEFYHLLVMDEMTRRGWHPNIQWRKTGYRGKKSAALNSEWIPCPDDWPRSCLFSEHGASEMKRQCQLLVDWGNTHTLNEKDLDLLNKIRTYI